MFASSRTILFHHHTKTTTSTRFSWLNHHQQHRQFAIPPPRRPLNPIQQHHQQQPIEIIQTQPTTAAIRITHNTVFPPHAESRAPLLFVYYTALLIFNAGFAMFELSKREEKQTEIKQLVKSSDSRLVSPVRAAASLSILANLCETGPDEFALILELPSRTCGMPDPTPMMIQAGALDAARRGIWLDRPDEVVDAACELLEHLLRRPHIVGVMLKDHQMVEKLANKLKITASNSKDFCAGCGAVSPRLMLLLSSCHSLLTHGDCPKAMSGDVQREIGLALRQCAMTLAHQRKSQDGHDPHGFIETVNALSSIVRATIDSRDPDLFLNVGLPMMDPLLIAMAQLPDPKREAAVLGEWIFTSAMLDAAAKWPDRVLHSQYWSKELQNALQHYIQGNTKINWLGVRGRRIVNWFLVDHVDFFRSLGTGFMGGMVWGTLRTAVALRSLPDAGIRRALMWKYGGRAGIASGLLLTWSEFTERIVPTWLWIESAAGQALTVLAASAAESLLLLQVIRTAPYAILPFLVAFAERNAHLWSDQDDNDGDDLFVFRGSDIGPNNNSDGGDDNDSGTWA